MAKKITRQGSKVAPPPKHKQVVKKVHTSTTSSVSGFVEFIRTQGVVGIAIGFVMGTQAKLLIDQLSASFINPFLGLIVGSPEGLTSKTFYIQVGSRTATFGWGAFVYSVINFLIIAAVIYYTFKWLHLDKLDKKKD